MFTLIYRSIAAPQVGIGEFEKMLERARVSNHINGITGCLLYHGGCFLQLMEGDEEYVRKLYSKIEKDERHQDVELLYTEKVGERMFGKWSMLFRNLEDDSENGREKLDLFNELFHGSGIPAKPNRTKFVLWKQVHDLLSSECIKRDKLRAG